MGRHATLEQWVNECARLCQPDQIVWIDGSAEEKKRLEQEAFRTGELIELDQKKHPGCVYHRTAQNDVARTENLTYICAREKQNVGPTNNWLAPKEAYQRAGEFFKGSMKGRTMYVIPFSMGPLTSPFRKIGVELTDSIYVVLNMRIMTQMGAPVLEALGTDGAFTKGLHGKAELDEKRRLILHFPEDNAIWSVGSGYGGNVLLGKKCLALRIASFLGRTEGWLAEHMLILGIEDPQGKVEYVAGAFPSACGKTNLAMLIPPEPFRKAGYKVWTVGDDIAWLRVGPDGRLWAVNPETGFFGVVPGTNAKDNPNALATIRKNSIFTNVVLGADRTVWWEKGVGEAPAGATDWKGNPWRPGLQDAEGKSIPGAHPNSRFTTPAAQCPSVSPHWQDPQGVPLSALFFGARRESVEPLVYESTSWRHGVYVGATTASERTAAQYGKLGELRRDPMAMLPFCGYHMGDYFRHWLQLEQKITKPPKIFHVNWFRKGPDGKFLWPGFGENLRVLLWMLGRCQGTAKAKETPIGLIPADGALETSDLQLAPAALAELLKVDRDEWKRELPGQREFFAKFGDRLPKELPAEVAGLEKRLG